MKKFLLVLGALVQASALASTHWVMTPIASIENAPTAVDVTCYNDDSQDVINQDAQPVPQWGGLPVVLNPADCREGPVVSISDSGGHDYRVVVDGQAIYRDSADPVLEARVAPSGVVALLTRRGSVFVYDAHAAQLGVRPWFQSGAHAVSSFKLARNGGLLAITRDGYLVTDRGVQSMVHRPKSLYVAANSRFAVLMDDGRVLDGDVKELYRKTIDGAVAVKVAADGTVVWLTTEGRIGSTHDLSLHHAADPIVSFKINPWGRVAYLTRDGRLGRDGRLLDSGFVRVDRYTIHENGAVTAVDAHGRALYFR